LTDVTLRGIASAGTDPDLTIETVLNIGAMITDEKGDAVDVRDWRRPQVELVERCVEEGVAIVCRTPLAPNWGTSVTCQLTT